ncbi:hypothetical protein FA10DRAFT_268143 [Acaromyces ingoldii]|uniref:DNA replication factor Cdt1 C-terminal domain-containing protein n=1 Tax=Acaromyces ingoldii TaxID=215250 RepID=A0A316YJM3_9BASI|nr:hypothetical protein FA10DRAFT_268143 [Acaromyces ingoldii]PWN89617.1 hypothetical protein FA10DRAFT_268143 [Acaromyces ingoldii]
MAGSSTKKGGVRARAPPAFQPLVGHFKPGKPLSRHPSTTTKGKGPDAGIAVNVAVAAKEKETTTTAPEESTQTTAPSQEETMPPPTRASTPPPTRCPTRPPRTPTGPRTATLPSPDLFEPLQRSPVSVRTDPDSGKMFLMLSPRRSNSRAAAVKGGKAAMLSEGQGLGIYKATNKRSTSPDEAGADMGREARRKRTKSAQTYPSEDRLANPFLGFSVSSSSPLLSQTEGAASIEWLEPVPAAALTRRIRGNRSLALPRHLASLYALHAAIEHSLVVHLATAGTGGSPIDESSPDGTVSIPHLITYSTLRPLVEKSSGRNLSPKDLSRLLWIWSKGGKKDIGLTMSAKRVVDPLRGTRPVLDYSLGIRIGSESFESDDEDDVPFDEEPQRAATPPRTRSLTIDEPTSPSPSPRKKSRNGGVYPTRTPPQSPSSRSLSAFPGRTGGTRELTAGAASPKRGMNLVAMWNKGIEARKREVRKRLVDWSLRCFATWHRQQRHLYVSDSREEASLAGTAAGIAPQTPKKKTSGGKNAIEGYGGLWTPANSKESDHVAGQGRILGREQVQEHDSALPTWIDEWPEDFPLERITPIPCASLPSLDLDLSLPASASSSLRALHNRVVAPSSSPAAPTETATTTKAASSQPMSLTERIRAKEAAKRATAVQTLFSRRPGIISSSTSSSSVSSPTMDDFKRRSMLSRLCDISESLYMLFTKSRQPPTGGAQRRLPTLPMEQVIKAIMSSSKVSLSETEATKALDLLDEVAPGFVTVATVGRGKWVRLGSRLADQDGNEEGKEEVGDGAGEEEDEGMGESLLEAVRRRIRRELDN